MGSRQYPERSGGGGGGIFPDPRGQNASRAAPSSRLPLRPGPGANRSATAMTCPEAPDTPHVTQATDRHVFHAPPLDTTPPTREQPAWNSSLTGLALCGFLTLGVYLLLAHRSSNAAPWFIKVAVLILFGLSLAVATLAWMASRLESRSSGSGAMRCAAPQMVLEDLRLIHPGTLHLGRPFTVALQARVPAGAPTVRPPSLGHVLDLVLSHTAQRCRRGSARQSNRPRQGTHPCRLARGQRVQAPALRRHDGNAAYPASVRV